MSRVMETAHEDSLVHSPSQARPGGHMIIPMRPQPRIHLLTTFSDVRLHEQTRGSDSSLKSALLDQLRLMGMVANPAQAMITARMPWHRAAVIRNNRTMREFLLPQIQRKLDSTAENTQKKTIVDLAIKHVGTDGSGASKQKPSAEFIERLIANLKVFLFAGHDTTASTICFMMKLLQDNPSCMEELRAEHDAVLGLEVDTAAQTLITSPHLLQSLPYTQAVIKETLRLYPLAATAREPHPGFFLTATGSSVKYPMEGFGMWVSAPGLQRHPQYWQRPKDFLPERWMSTDVSLHPTAHTWVPFSMGPKNCIGMELAMIELKLVLVLTARTFDIEEAWGKWDIER